MDALMAGMRLGALVDMIYFELDNRGLFKGIDDALKNEIMTAIECLIATEME